MTTLNPQHCCRGHVYRDSDKVSSHYCPEGKRMFCQECATKGKTICPTHKVPVKF